MIDHSERFRTFLGRLPDAESLDDPKVLSPSVSIKRADYLLFGRSMIAEVKQLETDPAFKVQVILDRYSTQPGYPVVYGEVELMAVLQKMPAVMREDILREIYDAVTRSIRAGCEEANRQIRETRAHFGLSDASGVVFMLNDRIPILAPDVLALRINQQMHKHSSEGKPRFPEIACVCAITWAHFVRSSVGVPAHPIILCDGPTANSHRTLRGQMHYIVSAWTNHDAARLVQVEQTLATLVDHQIALPRRDA